MQTYFTELPSPSLKHRAHKYTSKKFVNGKWQYFYDDISGIIDRGKRQIEFNKAYNQVEKTFSKKPESLEEAISGAAKRVERQYNANKAYNNVENTLQDIRDLGRVGRMALDEAVKNGAKKVQSVVNNARTGVRVAKGTITGGVANTLNSARRYYNTNVTGKTYKDRAAEYTRQRDSELANRSKVANRDAKFASRYNQERNEAVSAHANASRAYKNAVSENRKANNKLASAIRRPDKQNVNNAASAAQYGVNYTKHRLDEATANVQNAYKSKTAAVKTANAAVTKAARSGANSKSGGLDAKVAKANYDYETKSLAGKATRAAKKTKKFVSNTTKNIADTFREAASKAKKKKKSK